MHTPSISSVLATLALGTTLIACGAPPATPGPNLNNRNVNLTLLHTADWHSRIPLQHDRLDHRRGLGTTAVPRAVRWRRRINWLIQRERAQSDRVLHLDSGDCFEGAPIFNFFNGEAEVRSLDATGVDGVAIGNHEFDLGAQNFALQYTRWATFPVLAANYLFDDPATPGSPGLRSDRAPVSHLQRQRAQGRRHRLRQSLVRHVALRPAEPPGHHRAEHARGRAVLHRHGSALRGRGRRPLAHRPHDDQSPFAPRPLSTS